MSCQSQEMTTRGLEPTLIRNLTDHMGNNLLHCACSNGHTSLLPFLTSRFANELSGALNDENRMGLNPVQLAIKVNTVTNLRLKIFKFEAAKNVVLNNILFALSWLRTKFNNSHFPYSCGLLSITLRGICRNFEKTASYNFKVEVGNRGPDHLASKLTFMS